MTASLYVPSEEFPTYADYRKARQRAYSKGWKKRNPEKDAESTNARARLRYADAPGYAEKRIALSNAAYAKNPEPVKARTRERAAKLSSTPEWKAKQRAYRELHSVEARLYKQVWAKKNAARVNRRNAARRALCAAATPLWANKQDIEDAYAEARHMQLHVDHIVPLNNPSVCGLHVWENLQLLTPVANMRKGNKFDVEAHHAC